MHYSAFRLFFVAHPRGFLHLGYNQSRNATKHTNNNGEMINKFANYFIDYLLFIEKRFVILPHNQKNIVIII